MAWKLKDTIPPEPASVTDLIDGDLDEVTKLDVSNRDLRRLPDDLWRLHNLRALDVSNNALQILPSRIGDLTRLNRLTLNNNPLRTLPAALKQLSALNVLSLVGAPIDGFPPGPAQPVEADRQGQGRSARDDGAIRHQGLLGRRWVAGSGGVTIQWI
jgi:hypothetical protein